MKRILALLVLTSAAWASDYYSLTWVKNIDNNMYSAQLNGRKFLVETRLCLHIAVYQKATLKYDPNAYDNKIIFDDDSVCDVENVTLLWQ